MDHDPGLAALLRSYSDAGVRPFDAGAIAASAIAAGGARRGGSSWRLGVAPWRARRVWRLAAIGLLLLAVALAALVGAMRRADPRPIAGSIAVSVYALDGQGGVDAIRVINPDGTGEIAFASTGHDAYPVWSPDGTLIAYTHHLNRGPVRVVNADGTGAHSITDGYTSALPVTWSPDGRRIAFVVYPGAGAGSDGIFVVNVDGSGLTRITGAGGGVSRLAWSPDGSLIAFMALVSGTVAREAYVHVVDPRTNVVTRVSDLPPVDEGDYAAPSWSTDGSRLLFAVTRSGDVSAGIVLAERKLNGWTDRLVVAGSNVTRDVSPIWVDHDRFVFRRGTDRLLVSNADGSGRRELLRADFFERSAPCVAPDGSRVAVAMAQEDGAVRGELLIVPIDDAVTPRRISTGPIDGDGPACSWQPVRR